MSIKFFTTKPIAAKFLPGFSITKVIFSAVFVSNNGTSINSDAGRFAKLVLILNHSV